MSEHPALGLLGLGARSGGVIIGTGGVRAALKRGDVTLVIVAADHSARTEQKVIRLARARRVPVAIGPRAEQLGRSVGRGAVQAVGVRDAQLASGLRRRLS